MNFNIDLKNIKEVHILEPSWNYTLLIQIVGRGIRHCSHYNVTNKKNRTPSVRVFLYSIMYSKRKLLTMDQEMYIRAEKKYRNIKIFERAFKEIAIDCALNKHGNMFEDEIKKYKNYTLII